MAKQKHILNRNVNNDFLIGIVLGIVVSVLLIGIFMATVKKKMGGNIQWYITDTTDNTPVTDSWLGQ